MARIQVLLLVLVLGGFVGSQSFFILSEAELAIVTQFGSPRRTIKEPGLHFLVPFTETVHRLDGRILGTDTPDAEYLTSDKQRLVADPLTRWRIVDPLVFYKTLSNEQAARASIDDIVLSELRGEIARREFTEIVGQARDPIMAEVTERVRLQTAKFGVYVVDVRIKRADLPQDVLEEFFKKMRSERERVAKGLRAQGEEEKAKMNAETDRERTVVLADAYEAAERIRGEGDAESAAVYAEAYGRDPEFYAFWRSLRVYDEALGADSTLTLTTGSELFRYLEDAGRR